MFPDILKNARITPCHKKDDKGNKNNYRPVSVLSDFFNLFEILIWNYIIWNYMELKFSQFLVLSMLF